MELSSASSLLEAYLASLSLLLSLLLLWSHCLLQIHHYFVLNHFVSVDTLFALSFWFKSCQSMLVVADAGWILLQISPQPVLPNVCIFQQSTALWQRTNASQHLSAIDCFQSYLPSVNCCFGLLLSLPLLMWIVVSCVTFLLLSSSFACCLGSHPSQTSASFSNEQHFSRELMPQSALVLLIAFRALPSVNCCLGLLLSSQLLLWIVISCDDLFYCYHCCLLACHQQK